MIQDSDGAAVYERVGVPFWETLMEEGLRLMLASGLVCPNGNPTARQQEHSKDTPARVVKAYKEFFSGCAQDPAEVLRKGFKEDAYRGMVLILDLDITSFCNHHLLPFVGKAHFAYIPEGQIVGLSKIPRFLDILAARPQVQEVLCEEAVHIFDEVVRPKGCALVMDCLHTCMSVRGARKGGITRTTSLRGVFYETEVRQEFLSAIGGARK